MEGRDIVVFGIQAWDIDIGSNCKNIAVEFARHNRVLYVNPPLDRITSLRQRKQEKVQKRRMVAKGLLPDLEQVSESLWTLYPPTLIESANWIGDQNLFRWVNRRNNRLLAADIRSALDRLGFADYLLFNDSSMFLGYHLGEFLQPASYIYYMRDNLIEVPYWRKHGLQMEPELISQANTVVNNSELYTEYGAQFNKRSFMVGQGCDLSLFDDPGGRLPIPEDLQAIAKPVIGYVGFLSSMRLDIALLEYMACNLAEWNLVLVGPQDENFKQSSLHQMPNVHFLGPRNSEVLPAYIKGFDVAINPQLINAWTQGNYPRKIDEYLAMGKPVLATQTRAMEMFREYVYLAQSKEDYVRLAYQALREDSAGLQARRKAFATDHSWENSVRAIYEAIKTEV